jgi:hypothetical protein
LNVDIEIAYFGEIKLKPFFVLLLSSFISLCTLADSLRLPQGKGKCPAFSFEAEKGWHLKSDRKAGDRWVLLDSANKQVARFDYKISNTDQKQLPEVESKKIKLGQHEVEKLTVTTSFPEDGAKASEGLITSYSFDSGRLEGLVVMTPEYSTTSGLDKKIEKMLGTLQ